MKTLNTVETAGGRLTYTLFSEESGGTERYGITVFSRIFGEEETATVRDITTEYPQARKFLFLLADEFVLPSTFSEVAEEFVAAAGSPRGLSHP